MPVSSRHVATHHFQPAGGGGAGMVGGAVVQLQDTAIGRYWCHYGGMKGICHNDVIPGETFTLMDTPIRHVGHPLQEGKINALFFLHSSTSPPPISCSCHYDIPLLINVLIFLLFPRQINFAAISPSFYSFPSRRTTRRRRVRLAKPRDAQSRREESTES